MGGMIDCDRVCLGVVWMSCLFSFNKQPSLVDETSVEEVYDN